MPERAEKQPQPPIREQPVQYEESTSLEDFQGFQDKQTAAGGMPPHNMPPPDNNSTHVLQPLIGNRAFQHLLIQRQIGQLPTSTIIYLQRLIGNRETIRLLRAGQSQTGNADIKLSRQDANTHRLISQVKTGKHFVSSLIQRRVPEAADIDDEALETSDPETNEANAAGLRLALRRVLQDMGEEERERFLRERIGRSSVRVIINGGSHQQLLHVIELMEQTPNLQQYVYGGPQGSNASISSLPNYSTIEPGIRAAAALMQEVGATATHDRRLQLVFGRHPRYGWRQAKARYSGAAAALISALEGHQIFTDTTGQSGEMGVGGDASYHGTIRIPFDILQDTSSVEFKDAFIHEAFHRAYADVQDAGGYAGEAGFEVQSAETKFRNADHYAEVCRRALNGVDGDPYRPAGGRGGRLSRTERAIHAATSDLTDAWIMSTNMVDSLRMYYETQQRGTRLSRTDLNTIQYYSFVLGLTYHRRPDNQLNQIDLVLAEGVARRLDEAKDIELDPATPGLSGRSFAELKRMCLETKLRHVGAIVGSTQRDVFMVEHLEQHDSWNTQAPPPRYLR